MTSKTLTTSTPSQDRLGFQAEGFDWNEYIKYRPSYPPSFYNRFYDEHAKNHNTFGIVNDVGAGAGIASEKLAEKFKKVIVSEPNARYVKIAENRLNSLGKFPKDKFSFLPEGGEKSSLPDASLDCLTICEALHWTDIQTSINEFARCLKSGGTLGIFHYSPPMFEDPEMNELLRKLYGSAANRYVDIDVYTRAFLNLRNGYQNVYFDGKIWKEGVRRVYVNTKGDLETLRVGIARESDVSGEVLEHLTEMNSTPAQNHVAKTDLIEWIEGDEDWYDDVDAEWIKNCYHNMILAKKEEDSREAMENLLRAMGDRKYRIVYPAVQIIATKR